MPTVPTLAEIAAEFRRDVIAEYAAYLQREHRKRPRELRQRHEQVAKATPEQAPDWLRLVSIWALAGLAAIREGQDVKAALGGAVAESAHTDAIDFEEVQRAVEQLAFIVDLAAEQAKPAPVVGELYPLKSAGVRRVHT